MRKRSSSTLASWIMSATSPWSTTTPWIMWKRSRITFFSRTLKAGVTPYVVTKKTVFKWQEPFWAIHKKVFDENYKAKFLEKGLLDNTGGSCSTSSPTRRRCRSSAGRAAASA